MPLENDWWDDIFPVRPHAKPPGADEMLRVIAYDIACPQRLRRVANLCLDYGVRVQKSVFECWLDDDRFTEMWSRLEVIIERDEDQLRAYAINQADAGKRQVHGKDAILTERRSHYAF